MSDNDSVISDEAVEAAAKAAYEVMPVELFGEDAPVTWEQLSGSLLGQARKDQELRKAKQALAAAAPHMNQAPLVIQGPSEGADTVTGFPRAAYRKRRMGLIPDEAVNAAQKAYIALRAARDYKDPQEYAEAMLEAAAPYMLAGAWDEGAEESADHWAQTARNPNPNGPTDPPRNPYRSQP